MPGELASDGALFISCRSSQSRKCPLGSFLLAAVQDESPRFAQCPVSFMMRYNIDMDQDNSEEEKAIQELEQSRDDDDNEELWACSE